MKDDYIPFGKPNFSEEEISAVAEVLTSGWVGMGSKTISFEQELAEYLSAPHVVTVNSCTSALFLSLLMQGIGPGDEVICPSLTWCSTANVALYLGAKPVFCDVDPETMCLTPETIENKLTKKTRAVMVVHYGGLAVDVLSIREQLPQHVAIVEDAAHALGARYPSGKKVGSSGASTCFSFYANKNLSTGEGGAIALFDEEKATRLKSLRLHGLPVDAWKRYNIPNTLHKATNITELGYKMNYTDLQACIGRIQLRKQAIFAQRRKQIAEIYTRGLTKLNRDFAWQQGVLDDFHARHLFVIKLPPQWSKCRDEFVLELKKRNIGASIHYQPLHKVSLYGQSGVSECPETDKLCKKILTLPISASMSATDAENVLQAIEDVMSAI